MGTFFEQEAQELYIRAKAHNCIDDIYADMQVFKEGVGGQLPFMQMMTNEAIVDHDKAKLIQSLLPFFKEDTQQFFTAFVEDGMYDVIYQGVEHFEWLYHEHHIKITSAIELTQQQIQRIIAKIAFKMNRVIDTYSTVIDDQIIAGIKVESHTFISDSTVTAQLKAFQQEV
ncbi:F0F1 ATP synthase subunit delta [Carnobacteriaceae bacterium zg-C25]|nr:F0F1 ATP synthase subunit delta [Carnobacteriaceae bacterium zg-C25]